MDGGAGRWCDAGELGAAPHALTPEDQQRIDQIIQQMTLDQKLDYIGGTGFAVRAVPELKLPAIEMSDGPYGTRSNAGFPSTTYAAGIGLAASWDRELAARVGAGIGRDARARGVHYMLGPGVNIYRSPRNGRNFEYFGEDPFLSAAMTTGYITGMQAQGVSATVKRPFTYYDPAAKKWTINPGKFTVHVGDLVEATPLNATVTLSGEAGKIKF